MVAAENGALPQGKVGGVGDVLRDLPPALAARGWETTVLTPAYGLFGGLPGARRSGLLEVPFAAGVEPVEVYEIPGRDAGVHYRALEHPVFSAGGPGRIYCDDGPDAPFYTDAGKFALFSAAAAAWVLADPSAWQVLHLHDWHTGLFFALRRFDPRCRPLQQIRSVFSIHNLAFQGTRPLRKSPSSLRAWFPQLRYRKSLIGDPRYADCVNPMAAAVRLADKLHTVSPSYAEEIQRPSDTESGFVGGEGLEGDLKAAAAQGRLIGILNGCDYPADPEPRPSWEALVRLLRAELTSWLAQRQGRPAVHALADQRARRLPVARPAVLLTSVGRTTSQKMRLFRESVDGRSALQAILEELGDAGILLMLGSGEPDYESFLSETMARHENFLFLRGYSERLADTLYAAGDMFLMPSSFEPCGISQMLAMRAGQPCVVHAVGGLRDTVDPGCGFPFDGATPSEQARNLVTAVARALAVNGKGQRDWLAIRCSAAEKRFGWDVCAARLDEEVYAA